MREYRSDSLLYVMNSGVGPPDGSAASPGWGGSTLLNSASPIAGRAARRLQIAGAPASSCCVLLLAALQTSDPLALPRPTLLGAALLRRLCRQLAAYQGSSSAVSNRRSNAWQMPAVHAGGQVSVCQPHLLITVKYKDQHTFACCTKCCCAGRSAVAERPLAQCVAGSILPGKSKEHSSDDPKQESTGDWPTRFTA